MSENELEHKDISEETGNEDRRVPVTEAIRYRKRAQAAEKELAEMKAERDLLESQKQAVSKQLGQIQQEQQIRELLTEAAVNDLEAALLLVRERMASAEEQDPRAVIERLRKEKQYLFASPPAAAAPARTAGLRHLPDNSAALREAAKKAARSGTSADLQEYLRARRHYR